MLQTKNRKSLLYILKQASESHLIASDSLNCKCTRKRTTSHIKLTESYDCERRQKSKKRKRDFQKIFQDHHESLRVSPFVFSMLERKSHTCSNTQPEKMALSRWLR